MNIELTTEEAKTIVAFLNRVQLQGNEAETLVYLKQKLLTKPSTTDGEGSKKK